MNYCSQCGFQLLESSRFCGNCGCPVPGSDTNQTLASGAVAPGSMPATQPLPAHTPAPPEPQSYQPPPVPAARESNRYQAASQPRAPITGSHLPFLLALSGFLLLLAALGLILFLTVGLASTISEDQLADMGLDCEPTEVRAKDLFAEIDFQYDVPGKIEAQKCQYSNFSSHLYVSTQYRSIYLNILDQEVCNQDISSDSIETPLEHLEAASQEIGNDLFQAGQYVFHPENSIAREMLEDLLRDNDIQIHEEEIILSCQ